MRRGADAEGAPGPDAGRLREAAADVFGWDRLRPAQLEAMCRVLEGRDTLVVMPTGAGKSAVYQVPGLLLPGPTVVVSPLLSLQRDQMEGLPQDAATRAVAVNSGLTAQQTEAAWQAVRDGAARYVFLSPEQLAKPEVVRRLAAAGPSLFVVDEAQCVSVWGHDFRPDYLRLAQAVQELGRPVVLALTATAAPPVREEIGRRLGMAEPAHVVTGFDRPNLTLQVRRFHEDADKRSAVVETAAAQPKPGIVYTATRKDAEAFAAELAGLGLRAAAYHAGLAGGERAGVHDAFLAGELDVVAATSAFGMGIDKEDVRFVLHASVPGSLDAYYQEIGRAGRDEEPALAVLHYRPEDLGLQKLFAARTPGTEVLEEVASRVRDQDGALTLGALQDGTDLPRTRVTAAVNLLQDAGGLAAGDDGELRAAGDVPPEEAAEQAEELAESRRTLERTRVEMMRAYAETTQCRRRLLLGYFGEEYEQPCGNCDVCLAAQEDAGEPGSGAGAGAGSGAGASAPDAPAGRTSAEAPAETPDGTPAEAGFRTGARVRHRQWGDGMVLGTEQDRVTVLFDAAGYRTLSLPAVLDHGLLEVIAPPTAP